MRRIIGLLFALAAFGAVKAADFTVSTVAELQAIAAAVNSGDNSYQGATITLTADLDLGQVEWMPIGTTTHPFLGTFDGQGHTLSNLNVNIRYSDTGGAAGLFGQVGPGGMVKDVHIKGGTVYINANPNGFACYLGGVVGINQGTVVGCSNTALVNGNNWQWARIGGVVGKNNTGGRVQSCYNLGEVYTSHTQDLYVGGVVGNNKGSIENCFMSSKVRKYDTVQDYPLLGNNDTESHATITGCFYANGKTTHVTQPVLLENSADNSATISANLGAGKNVVLQGRKFVASGDWNTLCLPFDIPAGTVEGYSPIAVAEVMELVSSTFADGLLTLYFEDAPSMQAGKPYIVRWKPGIADNIPDPCFLNATLSDASVEVPTEYANFVGCTSPVTITGENRKMLYLGAGNTLYYPSGAMTIQSFRGYFTLNDLVAGDPSTGVSIQMHFDDGETTAIRTLEPEAPSVQGTAPAWYTLGGARLSGQPTAKGVYICGGRKVVIK